MVNSLPDWIRACRKRRIHRQFFEDDRRIFFEKIYQGTGTPRILTGCFKDMLYLNTSNFGPIAPKWLGSYEFEIQDLVSQICSSHYSAIVNVGSAEGYYAVGFARAGSSPVFAFDIDPLGRRALHALAQMNRVADRIVIRDSFIRNSPKEIPSGKGLLLVDIEGGELELLDPGKRDFLRRFEILVELHPSFGTAKTTDTEEIIRSRFAATHEIERRMQTDRFDWLKLHESLWKGRLSAEESIRATNEFRTGHQVWLWLKSS